MVKEGDDVTLTKASACFLTHEKKLTGPLIARPRTRKHLLSINLQSKLGIPNYPWLNKPINNHGIGKFIIRNIIILIHQMHVVRNFQLVYSTNLQSR